MASMESRTVLMSQEELKKGKVTAPLAITAFIAVLGSSFPHGFNTGVLNAPQHLIKDFINSSYSGRIDTNINESMLKFLWSLTVAIYLLGGMFGAFAAGWVADRFGRKRAILIMHIPTFVASLMLGLCRVSNSFELMIIGRFIIGFGCGAGSGLVPMYMTEIAPINLRGSMGVLHQLALTSGILMSQIIGLREILGNTNGWHILLTLNVIPAAISLLVLPFFPDSPRYLLVKRQDEHAAEYALRKFRGKEDVSADIKEMREEQKQHLAEPEWSLNKLFRNRSLRMPLIIVSSLALIQQLSGINVVFYYSTNVFERAGIPKDMTQYASLGMGAINVVLTVISVPLMEKAGRRTLLLGGMILMVISMIIITIALNLQSQVSWMAYVSVFVTVTFVIGFAIGLGSIPQFIGAELFKQGPRPAAMSFGGLLNWLANFLVAIMFPTMEDGMKAFSFLPFMVLVAVFMIFLFYKLPETKNKSFAEIAAIFHIRDEEEDSDDDEEKPMDQLHDERLDSNKKYEPVPTYDIVTITVDDNHPQSNGQAETSFSQTPQNTDSTSKSGYHSKKEPHIPLSGDVKNIKERISLLHDEEVY